MGKNKPPELVIYILPLLIDELQQVSVVIVLDFAVVKLSGQSYGVAVTDCDILIGLAAVPVIELVSYAFQFFIQGIRFEFIYHEPHIHVP